MKGQFVDPAIHTSSKQHFSLLVVDDDAALADVIATYFRGNGYDTRVAHSLREALDSVATFAPDAAIIDCQLSDGNGIDLISPLTNQNNSIALFILTGYATIEMAVTAMKLGADQFFTKPIDIKLLAAQVAKGIDTRSLLRRQTAFAINRARWAKNPFLGSSPAIQNLQREVESFVDSDLPVLIHGETGTGKGVLAEWLHNHGPRSGGAFLVVNSAGLSKEFFESELFGHEKGAFTGAVNTKTGLLETAHRGTAFLDEIGDMDLAIQAKLLKVAEEKTFRHLGGIRDHVVDIRLISATHCDLPKMVRSNHFRSDLYFRLNTISIDVPTLRSRPEDVSVIALHIIERLRDDLGRPNLDISLGALNELKRYHWPGNIRELRSVLERAALVTGDRVIDARNILLHQGHELVLESIDGSSDLTLRTLEANHIRRVLDITNWSVTHAAECLGIAKSTLYCKLRDYHLSAKYRA
jgi:DNA-binding NtrC family response regulator